MPSGTRVSVSVRPQVVFVLIRRDAVCHELLTTLCQDTFCAVRRNVPLNSPAAS